MRTVRQAVLIYVVPALLLYAVIAHGLWRTLNQLVGMYANDDGMWAAWNALGIIQWGYILDLSPFNPLAGMGSLFLPNLPWLNPGALALGLPLPKELVYLASYTIYYAELFCSAVVLFRSLGISPIRSSIGGQLYVLLTFPPTSGFFGTVAWYSMAPFNAHLVAVANFAFALYIHLGRESEPTNVARSLAIVALIFVGLFSAPITFLTYLPAYGIPIALLLVVERHDKRVLAWRGATLMAVVAAVFLAGFANYISSTMGMSARASAGFPPAFWPGGELLSLSYWAKLIGRFSFCGQAAQPLCTQYTLFWFEVSAVVGAFVAVLSASPRLRTLGLFYLVFIAAIETYSLISQDLLLGRLHTFSTPYLGWSSYIFMVLFITVLLDKLPTTYLSAWHNARAVSIAAVVFTVPTSALWIWQVKLKPNQHAPDASRYKFNVLGRTNLRQPVRGPISEFLVDNASIKPGAGFRGYVATYLGDPRGHTRMGIKYPPEKIPEAMLYVGARQYLDKTYGFRFQEVDLWELNIPTLEEYGQWITIPAFAFMEVMFRERGEGTNGAFLKIYKISDVRLLALLGVRFLITDFIMDQPGVKLRTREESIKGGPMFLYELANPNMGYSPKEIHRVSDFQSAIQLFGVKSTAFANVPPQLHEALNIRFSFEKDGFRVMAKSSGPAVVILPIQFSHCLRADAPIRLFRANAIQTAVEFNGELDAYIRLDFGLGRMACRRHDVEDVQAMGISY